MLALPVESSLATEDPRYVRYGPTDEQVDVFLNTLSIDLHGTQPEIIHDHRRLILVSGGERAGKSFISGLFGATRTPFGSVFWIVGPDYELARPEFTYWVDQLSRLGAIARDRDVSMPKVGKCQAVTKTGQIIETKTADETKKLAAVAPDGIIMAEAAQHDYDSYIKCVGRVAEKRGWVLMSGTFEGSAGWYADKYEEWTNPNNSEGGVAYSLPSWDNRIIYPGGRQDPEILRLEQIYSRVEGLFEERLGAVPVPPSNMVFRDFRHSIHVNDWGPFNPDNAVYLAVDPSGGGNPYSVLACQFIHHERPKPTADPIDFCYVFDEIYEQGKIGEDMMEIARKRPWWKCVKGGAIDVEAPDEKKRWLKYTGIVLHADKVPILSGIRRLKSFLSYKKSSDGKYIDPPHLVIHPRVKSLPYEFRKYRRDMPKDEDHEMRDEPPKNVPDHSLKALWYLLIARYGDVKGTHIAKPANTYKRKK